MLWPYGYQLLLEDNRNDEEVQRILGEINKTDMLWEERLQDNLSLIKRLKEIGELKIYNELKKSTPYSKYLQ